MSIVIIKKIEKIKHVKLNRNKFYRYPNIFFVFQIQKCNRMCGINEYFLRN